MRLTLVSDQDVHRILALFVGDDNRVDAGLLLRHVANLQRSRVVFGRYGELVVLGWPHFLLRPVLLRRSLPHDLDGGLTFESHVQGHRVFGFEVLGAGSFDDAGRDCRGEKANRYTSDKI